MILMVRIIIIGLYSSHCRDSDFGLPLGERERSTAGIVWLGERHVSLNLNDYETVIETACGYIIRTAQVDLPG